MIVVVVDRGRGGVGSLLPVVIDVDRWMDVGIKPQLSESDSESSQPCLSSLLEPRDLHTQYTDGIMFKHFSWVVRPWRRVRVQFSPIHPSNTQIILHIESKHPPDAPTRTATPNPHPDPSPPLAISHPIHHLGKIDSLCHPINSSNPQSKSSYHQ